MDEPADVVCPLAVNVVCGVKQGMMAPPAQLDAFFTHFTPSIHNITTITFIFLHKEHINEKF